HAPAPAATLFPYTTLFRSEQARSAVERQLSHYLKNPKVTLSLDAPAGARVAGETNLGNRGTPPVAPSGNVVPVGWVAAATGQMADRKSTRLNSRHQIISYT